MSASKLVLVTGATGQQGGSVAHALLALGHSVRGMTRNTSSEKAQALAAAGAEMVEGDFSRADSLAAALDGVHAVFAMSTPFEAGEDAEVAQGKAIVDAAVAAGVDHFVYTSVASADRETGIPHFDSKWEVEKHLAATDLDWSVIAPVYFMDNLFFPDNVGAIGQGAYPIAMPSAVKLQQVSVRDIGRFGAFMIDRKDEFLGRRVDIAADDLNATETAEILSRVLGRPIQHVEVPIDQIRAWSEDLAIMYEWFVSHGYTADIASLRSTYPSIEWESFEEFVTARANALQPAEV